MTIEQTTPFSVPRALEIAAQLFAARGYDATTTRELSRSFNMTNGTFYHYFPSKEALLVKICHHALSTITAATARVLEEVPRGRPAVEALVHAHLEAMLRDRYMHKTMLTEIRSLTGADFETVRTERDRYQEMVRVILRQAQSEGALRKDIDASILTLFLLNLLNWTIFWYDPNGRLSPEDLATKISTTFLDGTVAQQSTGR